MKSHCSPGPDIRFSDVANYVGVTSSRPTPKSAPRHKVPLQENKVVATVEAQASNSFKGTEPNAVHAGRLEKARTELEWLRAEQRAEQNQAKKLDMSLSDSMLLERRAHQRVEKQREMRDLHQQKAENMEQKILKLRDEITVVERAAANPPNSHSRSAKPDEVKKHPVGTRGSSGLRSAGNAMASREINSRETTLKVAPPSPNEERRTNTNVASAMAAFGGDIAPAAPSDTSTGNSHGENFRRCSSEPSHSLLNRVSYSEEPPKVGITLKDYFERSPSSVSTSGARGSHMDISMSTSEETYMPIKRKSQRSNPNDPEELCREAIRKELIKHAGNAKSAFKRLDVNNSGHVSFQEFADGVARLGVNWPEITGFKRQVDLFKLFDCNRDGVIDFLELFGQEVHDDNFARMSTPEFWGTWCRRTRDIMPEKNRGPKWEPSNPDEEIQLRNKRGQTIEDVAHKKKWMAATIRRLKSRGKSDARCREVVALHLPRGTGPKDRDEVQTFSEHEVKVCRKRYIDQIQDPVKNIQKVVYDMKEQRKTLQNYRHKLWTVTMEQHHRQQHQDDIKKTASSITGLFAKVKEEDINFGHHANVTPLSPSRSSESGSRPKHAHFAKLAPEYGLEEDEMEDLYQVYRKFADVDELLGRKGFGRLVQALCTSREVPDPEIEKWWAELMNVNARAKDSEAKSAESRRSSLKQMPKVQCTFTNFAAWYGAHKQEMD